MCVQNCCSHVLPVDGVNSAEESLLFYCKPVELYNILRRRALSNPCFLKRCLRYERKPSRKRRRGNGLVIFNYKDHHNMMRKTEVTEEFSCPFCLMQCVTFKGLRLHLNSSHDLFNYDFWVSDDYQAVNVSLKFDTLRSENFSGGKQHLQTFSFCSSLWRRKNHQKNSKEVHVAFLEFDSSKFESENTIKGSSVEHNADILMKSSSSGIDAQCSTHAAENHVLGELLEHVASSSDFQGYPFEKTQISSDLDCKFPPENEPTSSVLAPAVKSRKLTSERRTLLQKRQFYHSHRVQPMALEQVVSDKDSEDEVDDEIADLEDRRMLDDFVDVSKDEKQLMHLWNSFVRKQRVIADGHVAWACEAFSKLHRRLLRSSPSLFWCWRLFMIKLWNHGLLDASSMNNCNLALESLPDD